MVRRAFRYLVSDPSPGAAYEDVDMSLTHCADEGRGLCLYDI
jgi:hypothetical protein